MQTEVDEYRSQAKQERLTRKLWAEESHSERETFHDRLSSMTKQLHELQASLSEAVAAQENAQITHARDMVRAAHKSSEERKLLEINLAKERQRADDFEKTLQHERQARQNDAAEARKELARKKNENEATLEQRLTQLRVQHASSVTTLRGQLRRSDAAVAAIADAVRHGRFKKRAL